MAGLGDQMAAAAAGRGEFWVLLPDREQAIEALQDAFVQGRLGKDEFDARIGHALAAPTYADLDPATADLPAGLTAARPRRKPARVGPRRPVNGGVKWGAYGLITPAVVAPAYAVGVLFGSNVIAILAAAVAFTFAFLYFAVWLLYGAVMLWEWLFEDDWFWLWRRERCRKPPRFRRALYDGRSAISAHGIRRHLLVHDVTETEGAKAPHQTATGL
jgi:hypothetical protein